MKSAAKLKLIAILLSAPVLASGPVWSQETGTDTQAAPVANQPAPDPDAGASVDASGILDGPALDELTSPIALFPDELLGQVLVATTYPMDVVKADRFLLKNADLSDKERAAAVNKEEWADSVKSLAAGFPELIGRMSEHIDWTESMGDALIVQTDDVLDSIQRLRAQAKANGYLEDNAAMDVGSEEASGDITISSADPEVIYVPQYTETVYTTPAPATPYYVSDGDDWGDALATGAIIFGGALLIDEIFDDDWGNGWDNGYWHGDGGGGIDWDGDMNIDNGINIGNGNGNNIGNRPGRGDGERPAIGDRPENIKHPALGSGERLGAGSQDRIDKGRDANFRPTEASREAAREKVAKRQADGLSATPLPAAKGKGDRGVAAKKPAKKSATKASPNFSKGTTKPKAKSTPAARPSAKSKPPTARKPAAKAPAYKPSGGSRAKAAGSRGSASRGGGGGRSGGSRGGRRG